MDWVAGAQLAIGGINLALVLRIILNDLRHLRDTFSDHLRDHATRKFDGPHPS